MHVFGPAYHLRVLVDRMCQTFVVQSLQISFKGGKGRDAFDADPFKFIVKKELLRQVNLIKEA